MKLFKQLCCAILLAFAPMKMAYCVNYGLSVGVEKHNADQGEESYDISVSISKSVFDPTPIESIDLTLTSPTGEQFFEISPLVNWVFASIEDVTPANLDSSIAGTWTIDETLDGTIHNQYEFTVPNLLGSSHFTATPIITEPANGAVVGPKFDLRYTNGKPNEFGLSSSGTSIPPGQDSLSPKKTLLSPGHLEFDYSMIPGFSGWRFNRLSVFNSDTVSDAISVVGLNSTANSTFHGPTGGTRGWITYKTLSPPISLTVVPEPAGMALILAGFLVASVRRRP